MAGHVDELMEDHALIEKGLVLMERELQGGTQQEIKNIEALLEFLLEYGEHCHNMKEERVYFPLIQERGLPPGGPVSVMLQEHEQERNFLKHLAAVLNARESSPDWKEEFRGEFAAYAELTKNHIWKENDILYPMGKRVLGPDDDQLLLAEFGKIEEASVGRQAKAKYGELLDRIESGGAKIDLLAALSTDTLSSMLDALPVEISFVDENDIVRYFNRLQDKKIFPRTLSVIGRPVQKCHPQKSVHMVNQILTEMRLGKRDRSTFWINFEGMLVHISYFAVRDQNGSYRGCVEMVQDIAPYRELQGEKRLLDSE